MLYVNPITEMMLQRGESVFTKAEQEKAVLQSFEQLFANQLLRAMRSTIQKGDLLNGGREQEIYEEMLDDVLSGYLAESGQLGLAAAVAEQIRVGALQAEIREQLHGGPSNT